MTQECNVLWNDPATLRLFKALCEPNRLQLLLGIAQRREPVSVSELKSCCDLDLSVISRHLALLRDAGAVEARRHGKEVHYTIRSAELIQLFRGLADSLEECCPKDEPPGKGNEAKAGRRAKPR